MQAIKKTKPSPELAAELSQAESLELRWADDPPLLKSLIRQELYDEQLGLCCYCMQEIEENRGNIIEHFHPRSLYPDLTFSYENLLLACDCTHGIERLDEDKYPDRDSFRRKNGMRKREIRRENHCDRSKADHELSIPNPATWTSLSPSPESLLTYSIADGSIDSNNPDMLDTIEKLHLNSDCLKTKRRRALASMAGSIEAEISRQKLSSDEANLYRIQRYRLMIEATEYKRRLESFKSGDLHPFSGALRAFSHSQLS